MDTERIEVEHAKAKGGESINLDLRSLVVKSGRGSTTDAVTDALREAILTGLLHQDTWLREGELAEALQVSRTPVREALRRLSDEGMTQRVANRGTVVAPITFEEILAVYSVRTSLEGLAARLAALRNPPGLVEELIGIQREMAEAVRDDSDVSEINLRFHRAIRDAARNPYLERFLVQVENAVRRFGETTFNVPGRLDEVLVEHQAIIEAIAASDPDTAELMATSHMRKARDVRTRQMLSP